MNCPSCGSKNVKGQAGNKEAVLYHCFACNKTFSISKKEFQRQHPGMDDIDPDFIQGVHDVMNEADAAI